MGLRVPSPICCLNLSEQIAQKLHACTGPYSAGRARDVLDILLIELLGKLDVKDLGVAAEQVFEERAIHAFPPTFKSQRSESRRLKCWQRSLATRPLRLRRSR